GSRRLAILDLSERGRMPMATRDGRYHIAYNGEVYNYRELRAELQAKGHVFESDTDTEVVLKGYAEEGAGILEKLDGMFAIAIWDAKLRELFLARDHAGIKPLYYYESGGEIYFASEEKALFAAGVPFELDPGAAEELMCFGYVAGERTPFRGVRRLLAGHYLVWNKDGKGTTRWWNLADRVRKTREELPQDPESWLREALDASVQRRRISDVPVGVLLSGGLDSTAIAASLAKHPGKRLSSFTVRMDDPRLDESADAKQAAKALRLDYHDLILRPERLPDKSEEASWINDEPMLHASTPHLLSLSRFAKPRVSVLLSGEGSDEIFAGYYRYHLLNDRLARTAAKLLPDFAAAWHYKTRRLKKFSGLRTDSQAVFYNSAEIFPAELASLGMERTGGMQFREQVLAEAEDLYPDDLLRQAMYYDQHTFLASILDRNDRMTMGASIECRVPFLDSRIMEIAGALPTRRLYDGKQGKLLLRQSQRGRVPDAVLSRNKRGFDVPWPRYLAQDETLRRRLAESAWREPFRSIFSADGRKLSEKIKGFLKGDGRQAKLMLRLWMVSVWYEAYSRKIRDAVEPRPASLAEIFSPAAV
ncbi:MAG TPA: asparagine synthase (glutamine-hydrolyzing), partial [Verrucomicrobiae bacterium]|nr:asparagine synthase (glutamine-hydrolyzing) [Verrucomicrobiae bacterium]